MSTVVQVEHIRKTFGKAVAVADVSFEVLPGEVFGLLGPNGAGKTTTIRIILDIFKPDAGRVAVFGGPLTQASKDRIGYMPEDRGLYQDMRLEACLTYLGALKGLTKAEAARRSGQYLERLGLWKQRRDKISSLSRGMGQKAQVIAAVLHDPDLLIIDEPFANLDPVNAQLVREIIMEMRAGGKAVVITSHQLALLETLCDRMALVHEGTVVLYGALREIRRQFADSNIVTISGRGNFAALPGVAHAERRAAADWRLTLEDGASPEQLLRSIASNGLAIDRFEVALPTLDEIFLRVVRDSVNSNQ